MKTILIIYPFYTQKSLMETFAKKLNEKGLLIDVLCLNNGELRCQSDIKWDSFSLSLLKKSNLYGNNIIVSLYILLLRFIFSNCFFPRIAGKYDLLDFHSFTSLEYIWLMKQCKNASVPYDITLWGSDVLRARSKTFKRRRESYMNSRLIKGVPTLINTLKCHYGDLLNSKYRESYFGNSEIDRINNIEKLTLLKIKNKLIPDITDKLIITCGYNSQPAQQHFKILEAVNKLSTDIKKKIHVILPLTYPKNEQYIEEIRKKLTKIDVSYTLLTNYLTNDEVAVLRRITDIAINIQTTDAFAASIQSHLYCQNVVILGEWLNYPKYEKNNVFYLKCSLKELPDMLYNSILRYDEYKQKCLLNKTRIHAICSWEGNIFDWVSTYKEIVSA